MRIRSTSWHYRLWKLGRDSSSEPRDLCRYFWHLVLLKILPPLIVVGLAAVGVGALIYVIWTHPTEFAIGTTITVAAIAAIIGLILYIRQNAPKWSNKRWERRQARRSEPPKEPSPFWEYLKARKRKVCPLITVVEDK